MTIAVGWVAGTPCFFLAWRRLQVKAWQCSHGLMYPVIWLGPKPEIFSGVETFSRNSMIAEFSRFREGGKDGERVETGSGDSGWGEYVV